MRDAAADLAGYYWLRARNAALWALGLATLYVAARRGWLGLYPMQGDVILAILVGWRVVDWLDLRQRFRRLSPPA